MKIREGFVSNSSTTSYTCDICGATESGYDSEGIEDFGFYQCQNGHTICQEEAIGDEVIHCDDSGRTEEEAEKAGEEYDGDYCIKAENCPICQFQVISNPDISRYLSNLKGNMEDEAFEEVKKVNKRRKVLRENEYVEFMFRKFNLTEDGIIKELKSKFKTYAEFLNSLED